MQTVREKTLGERATPVSRISGKAVCCDCGGEVFDIIIYNDAAHDACCINKDCRTIWSPFGEGSGEVTYVSKAVADRGDEPSDMVSKG